MIDRTDDEIRAEVTRLWIVPLTTPSGRVYFDDPSDISVEIIRSGPGVIVLSISRMYDSPGLTLAQLEGLASFFKAKHVGKLSSIAEPGCETCDWNSKYGFELQVWGDS